MFDVKRLPRSPEFARRLINFCEISNLVFDEELVNLALNGLIHRDQFKNYPYALDDDQISALQYVNDWQGRSLLLGEDNQRLRTTALASVFGKDGGLLILSQPQYYHEWILLVQKVFPKSKISVFGNQRYLKPDHKAQFPKGIEFTADPDYESEIFITSYGGVIWNNFLSDASFTHTIIEELSNLENLHHKWETSVAGMVRELPNPIYLQNILDLPTETTMNQLAGCQIPMSKTNRHISILLQNYVRAGVPHILNSFMNDTRIVPEYLKIRGYKNFDFLKLYSLFGVSSHLIDSSSPIIFYDESIKDLKNSKISKQKNSGLNRLVEKQSDMLQTSQRTLSDTVRIALDGDDVMATLVGQLMDNQWATLKASHIKTFSRRLSGQMAKCLYLTSNMDLIRGLKIHSGTSQGFAILSEYEEPQKIKDRFLERTGWELIPLNHLVINKTELLDSDLFTKTNFIILGDIPLNRKEFIDLQELAKKYDIKLIIPITLSTWEEEIYQQLI